MHIKIKEVRKKSKNSKLMVENEIDPKSWHISQGPKLFKGQ